MARCISALVLALLATPAAAQSGQGSAAIAVSVEVLPNCTVSAAPLTFLPRGSGGLDAAADIAVACGPAEAFTVSLDRGAHPSGALRRAYDPAMNRYLAYQIYRDSGRSQPWGDGPGAAVGGVTNASGVATLKAWGGLVAGQDIVAGNYADQIIVTVNF